MYTYREVLVNLRLGESCRAIAQSKLVGHHKAEEIRQLALSLGLLDPSIELPDEKSLISLLQLPDKKPVVKTSKLLAKSYESQIRSWVEQGIQASTIHQALQRNHGFTGEYTCIRRLEKKIKLEVPPKASSPINCVAGESVQVDFGQGPEIVDVTTGETIKTWFFVMVLSWSRHQYVELVPNKKVETWLGCHKRAFEFFGGVPKKLLLITRNAL